MLLKKIIVRFVSTDKKNKEALERYGKFLESYNKILRIMYLIELWLLDYFYDFDNDPEMVKTLKTFLRTTVSQTGKIKLEGKKLIKKIVFQSGQRN